MVDVGVWVGLDVITPAAVTVTVEEPAAVGLVV
jgi:hypothetical protein